MIYGNNDMKEETIWVKITLFHNLHKQKYRFSWIQQRLFGVITYFKIGKETTFFGKKAVFIVKMQLKIGFLQTHL